MDLIKKDDMKSFANIFLSLEAFKHINVHETKVMEIFYQVNSLTKIVSDDLFYNPTSVVILNNKFININDNVVDMNNILKLLEVFNILYDIVVIIYVPRGIYSLINGKCEESRVAVRMYV